jgi:hemerythrin-like domain-containing protein
LAAGVIFVAVKTLHRQPAQPLHTPARKILLPANSQDPAVDAIALLKADHKVVKDLLTELTESSSRAVKKRGDLLKEIQTNLKAHTTIEEEIFYPAFKAAGKKEEEKMYFEALEEHRAAEDLVLPDLLNTDPATEQFSGRAKVLKELIEHHIEEEETEMFKDAKKLLSKEQLTELGAQMEQRKAELLTQLKAA